MAQRCIQQVQGNLVESIWCIRSSKNKNFIIVVANTLESYRQTKQKY